MTIVIASRLSRYLLRHLAGCCFCSRNQWCGELILPCLQNSLHTYVSLRSLLLMSSLPLPCAERGVAHLSPSRKAERKAAPLSLSHGSDMAGGSAQQGFQGRKRIFTEPLLWSGTLAGTGHLTWSSFSPLWSALLI